MDLELWSTTSLKKGKMEGSLSFRLFQIQKETGHIIQAAFTQIAFATRSFSPFLQFTLLLLAFSFKCFHSKKEFLYDAW